MENDNYSVVPRSQYINFGGENGGENKHTHILVNNITGEIEYFTPKHDKESLSDKEIINNLNQSNKESLARIALEQAQEK